jgi:hypothetical protein
MCNTLGSVKVYIFNVFSRVREQYDKWIFTHIILLTVAIRHANLRPRRHSHHNGILHVHYPSFSKEGVTKCSSSWGKILVARAFCNASLRRSHILNKSKNLKRIIRSCQTVYSLFCSSQPPNHFCERLDSDSRQKHVRRRRSDSRGLVGHVLPRQTTVGHHALR